MKAILFSVSISVVSMIPSALWWDQTNRELVFGNILKAEVAFCNCSTES